MILQSKFRYTENGYRTTWTIEDKDGYARLTVEDNVCLRGWLVKTTKRGWTIELFSIYTGKAESLFISREHFEEVPD